MNEIVSELIRYGQVRRPALGIEAVAERYTRRFRLNGVLIDSVAEGGGAAKAGLRGTLVDRQGYIRQVGDIIIKVGDTPVSSLLELKYALENYKSGDRATITYVRDNRPFVVSVELKYLE